MSPVPTRIHDRLASGLALTLLAFTITGAIGWQTPGMAADPADAPAPVPPATPVVPPVPVLPPAVAERPGTTLPAEPAELLVAQPPPSIGRIRAHLEAGDLERGMAEAERYLASATPGRERDAARMVVGMLHREADRHNLASEAFRAVTDAGGPLAPYAAYYAAEQDQRRGRPNDALRSCETYRRRWPSGPHAVDCLRIVALAQAELGSAVAARAAAAAYDQVHTTAPITEQIEVHLGLRLADTAPAQAVPVLTRLVVTHESALTGRVAEEQLARLASLGTPGAAVPTDRDSRMARAISLRQAGRNDAAWREYETLRAMSRADPALAAWIEEEDERFGWRTRRWDDLAALYDAEFRKSGDPRWLWQRYKVLARAGKYDEAATLAVDAQRRHGDSGYWRRTEEDVGRTLLLAKRYLEARDQFDAAATRGGSRGRRASFEAGFAALMGGEPDDAIRRLTELADQDPAMASAARYWRARAYRTTEREGEAQADQAWILANEPWSWYASLVRAAAPDVPTSAPDARDGSWAGTRSAPTPPPGPSVLDLPVADPVPPEVLAVVPAAWRPTAPNAAPGPVPLALLRAEGLGGWSWSAAGPARPEPSAVAAIPSRVDPEATPPRSYRASPLFDPDRGRRALAEFADEFAKPWPELQAISDLASVGLYDLSGPMLSAWYESWRTAVRKRDRTARKLVGTSPEAWRQVFLTARDHHHTAKDLYESWLVAPADRVTDAQRLGYPLAHDRYVWTHARQHDLDPYLVLGLMRQESTYDATARSRVGARGAMQIMPRTGHLLADLAHDVHFDAGDLEDPTVAVGYGIRYLGLLMRRFDGAYPLAVASYNGGPFNVSTWLAAVGPDTPMDVFVEHIPYRETRDYVKKVSEGYAAYVALYGPSSAQLAVPLQPRGDHPEVVDF